MIIVIDASVAAKLFFQKEHSLEALNLLSNPFELKAPDLLYLGMESLLCKRTRRKELSIAGTFGDGRLSSDADFILSSTKLRRSV